AARLVGRARAAGPGRPQARGARRLARHRGRDARGLPPGAGVKILVLTPTFLPVVGGAELVLLEVYRRLARRHDVRLLTPVLPESLRRDHGSSEYDALVTFPVERYEDRVTLMRVRGHRVTAGPPPPGNGCAVRAALDVPPGNVLVFALQRLAPEKRVDALLHALRRGLDAGAAVTLVIGGTGPEAPALRALAAELGIDKHVRFAG